MGAACKIFYGGPIEFILLTCKKLSACVVKYTFAEI